MEKKSSLMKVPRNNLIFRGNNFVTREYEEYLKNVFSLAEL
jgi:hypothetical protein